MTFDIIDSQFFSIFVKRVKNVITNASIDVKGDINDA